MFTRREPFKELYQLRDDFNRMMVTPFAKMMQGYAEFPQVDLYETEEELILKADLPGVIKEELDIRVARDSIFIGGNLGQENEANEENYIYRERSYGEFNRTIPFSSQVEYEEARASYNNGVLEIRVPKLEQEKGKKLHID